MRKWLRHPSDLQAPLTSAEMTGMALAGTTMAVLQVVISVFITYFFTNVVGIGAAVVGTLLLVTRVADGFTDLGMGVLVSRTRTRAGQARPWGLRMAFPLLAAVILTFFVPETWGQTAKTVYACAAYFLMITVAITPASLVGQVLGTNISVHQKSRQKFSIISTAGTLIGSVAGNVAVLQITESMGDSFASWRLVAVIFGLLAFAGQLAQYLLTRERNTAAEDAPESTLRQSFPSLLKNKYFLIMCAVGLFTALDGAMAGNIIYYAKYVLGRTDLMGLIGGVTLAFTLGGVALTPVLAKKIPPKRMILCGLAIKMAALLLNLMFPQNAALFLSLSALRYAAGAPMMVYGSVYLLSTIEYGEYKTGIRANHLIISVSSVASKIGSGIGGALIGWMLSFGGYDGAAAEQGQAAIAAINHINFLLPLIAAAVFALICFYDLDKKYDALAAELKARKNPAPEPTHQAA